MSSLHSVLIIDDVDTMREMLGQLVGGVAGLRVSGLAANTWEARLELSRRRPDLVLMDEILPGESSLDLLVEIQALSIPVLLVTGVEDPTHEIPPGVAGRLKKPGWDSLKADQERFRVAIFGALKGRSEFL